VAIKPKNSVATQGELNRPWMRVSALLKGCGQTWSRPVLKNWRPACNMPTMLALRLDQLEGHAAAHRLSLFRDLNNPATALPYLLEPFVPADGLP
jgi:hypothetical protein